MQKVIPLIGSSESGPLGVMQLPRLWSKVLLTAKGALHEEYDECGSGFDQMLLDGIGLDREATLQYLRANLPTYPQFEQWVLDQKGGSLDPEVVKSSNDAIIAYLHPDDTVASVSAAVGRPNDGSIKDAVTLNALEDWNDFHQALTGS